MTDAHLARLRNLPQPIQQTADLSNLVCDAEIARRLGVAQQTVYSWSQRYDDFPKRVVWTLRQWDEVMVWNKGRGL
jgi:hypothetical protein